MFLTATFRIYPNQDQKATLLRLIKGFEEQTNEVIKYYVSNQYEKYIEYNRIKNVVPWSSKNEVIKQAKIDFRKLRYNQTNVEFFKYNYCKWNNSSFRFLGEKELLIEAFNRDTMIVEVHTNDFVFDKINKSKVTSLKITKKVNKWIGIITYRVDVKKTENKFIMGIDLGIKVPAVISTSTNKVRFFGNGRERRYLFIKYKSELRKAYKNENRYDYVIANNLSRRLKYIDHKISKEIVDFAKNEDIGVIKLENLNRLQKRSKNSEARTWSYHRLMRYIIYKAKKEGIEVMLIDPRNTSKKCPSCQRLNNPYKRLYKCSCGYRGHRDIVGAINIRNSESYSQLTSL